MIKSFKSDSYFLFWHLFSLLFMYALLLTHNSDCYVNCSWCFLFIKKVHRYNNNSLSLDSRSEHALQEFPGSPATSWFIAVCSATPILYYNCSAFSRFLCIIFSFSCRLTFYVYTIIKNFFIHCNWFFLSVTPYFNTDSLS